MAYVAYHFHWSREELLSLNHKERHRWIQAISGINRKINESAGGIPEVQAPGGETAEQVLQRLGKAGPPGAGVVDVQIPGAPAPAARPPGAGIPSLPGLPAARPLQTSISGRGGIQADFRSQFFRRAIERAQKAQAEKEARERGESPPEAPK